MIVSAPMTPPSPTSGPTIASRMVSAPVVQPGPGRALKARPSREIRERSGSSISTVTGTIVSGPSAAPDELRRAVARVGSGKSRRSARSARNIRRAWSSSAPMAESSSGA